MHMFDQLIGFFKRPSRKELEDKIANLQEQVLDYQKECMRLESTLKRKTFYDVIPYKCNRRITREDLIACDSEQMTELYKTQIAHEFADKLLLDGAIEFYTKNDIRYGSLEIQGYLLVAIPREKHRS